jgi:AcrR family transcriptional regulator
MDRRIIKTRKEIINAFMKLLKKKGFEKITIQDIADEADINRGTVYLHFEDKYAIMDYCIDSYVGKLLENCAPGEEIVLKKEAFNAIFNYLGENLDIYKLLLENDKNNSFNQKLKATVESQTEMAVGHMVKSDGASAEIYTQFLVAGFLGVIDWWIRNYPACTAEEATDILFSMVTHITAIE